MKERNNDTALKTDDRRRYVRATLVGSALVVRRGKSERVLTAVLDNANRIGAGLHAKDALDVNEPVTVSFAFLDQNKEEQQEKLSGNVAWVKPWEKGYLIGVVWEQIVTKEKNPWLYSYLDETLKQTA
jgi:hypothetical protein